MAAAAILNLLFLFILIRCSISGSSMDAKFHSSTSIAAEILLFVQKSKMAAAAILCRSEEIAIGTI